MALQIRGCRSPQVQGGSEGELLPFPGRDEGLRRARNRFTRLFGRRFCREMILSRILRT